jgi:hypothetical protein
LSFLFACRQHRESLIGYIRPFLFVLIVPLPSSIVIATPALDLIHAKATSQSTFDDEDDNRSVCMFENRD